MCKELLVLVGLLLVLVGTSSGAGASNVDVVEVSGTGWDIIEWEVDGLVINGTLVGPTVQADVTGSTFVTLIGYAYRPSETVYDPFEVTLGYRDVRIDSAANVTFMKVRFYYNGTDIYEIVDWETFSVRWWNGAVWVACSSVEKHGLEGENGYLEVTINSLTSPTTSELVGTNFAFGGDAWEPSYASLESLVDVFPYVFVGVLLMFCMALIYYGGLAGLIISLVIILVGLVGLGIILQTIEIIWG